MSWRRFLFSVWKIGLQREWNVLKGAFTDLFGDFPMTGKIAQSASRNGLLRNTDGGLCGANEADGGKMTGMSALDWLFDFTGTGVAAIFSVPTGFGVEYPILGALRNTKSQKEHFVIAPVFRLKFVTLHEVI